MQLYLHYVEGFKDALNETQACLWFDHPKQQAAYSNGYRAAENYLKRQRNI